jgi:mannose-6-phosphate isomerase-like protein (cupin superfamily)
MRARIRYGTWLGLLLLGAPAAAAPPSGDVVAIDATEVRRAFEQGRPLLENDAYKVHASRRDAAGLAEVHERDTDLIYVLEGSATFVTGGRVVDAKPVAAQELRGVSIEGGTAREIGAGDVIVVPHGVPHWFRGVRGPLLYYVVKVSDGEVSR